ncbi:hypothetical protein BGZ58_002473 [Dissophora ornata]|nr:hypothetical protein BGZ58_002473 [Dissophora ornata]
MSRLSPAPVMDPTAPTRPPVSPPPPLRNIRLRFFLGPNNLGILQDPGEVMEEYPVIVYQHDYRFDVFGRPQDVVEAITESLLVVDLPGGLKLQRSDHYVDMGFGPYVESPLPPGKPNVASGAAAATPPLLDMNIQLESCSLQDSETHLLFPRGQNSSTTGPPTDAAPQRQSCVVPVEERKTDYDLEKARRSHIKGSTTGMPSSLTIILSMPELIAHYLIHRSGGFLSYLVGCQDLQSCERQGMAFETLKSMGKDVGLSVGVSRIRLSAVDKEIPVWLQADDMRAIRAVLFGVAWALATEPIFSKERKLITEDESGMRTTWLSKLQNHKGPAKSNVDDDAWVTSRDKGKQRSDDGNGAGNNNNNIRNVPAAADDNTQDRTQLSKTGSFRAQNGGSDQFLERPWDQV